MDDGWDFGTFGGHWDNAGTVGAGGKDYKLGDFKFQITLCVIAAVAVVGAAVYKHFKQQDGERTSQPAIGR